MDEKLLAVRWFQLFLLLSSLLIGSGQNYAQLAGSRAGDHSQGTGLTSDLPSLPEPLS